MQQFLKRIAPIWEPHEGQKEFLLNPSKIKVLACGRRWGKTDACAVSILAALFQPSPTRHVILAPTLDQAALQFDRVVALLEKMIEGTDLTFSVKNRQVAAKAIASLVRFSEPFDGEPSGRDASTSTDRTGNSVPSNAVQSDTPRPRQSANPKSEIRNRKWKPTRTPYPKLTFGQHTLVARSGHLGRSLRGNEATHIVVDEAAYVPEELITEVAMPMLATTQGFLTMISTPRGLNHFWRFFMMGQRGDYGVWSRRAPSAESPLVSRDYLEVQKQLISERAFRVEYEAEFLDAEGTVFRTEAVEGCLVARLPRPPDTPYTIGVDWARYEDYTTVSVLCGVRTQCMLLEIDRFTGLDWPQQIARVARLAERYPYAHLVCDATGVGDPVIGMLRSALPNSRITGETFTPRFKASLIDNLVWVFEQRSLAMEPMPELLRELQHYQATVSAAGNTKLGAQGGFHDDLVIALALAAKHLPDAGRLAIMAGGLRDFK